MLDMAHAGYYGGRFEVTHIGRLAQTVYEHDIRSAYPAAMLRLPCLRHGRWIKASASEIADLPEDALFVCGARFEHPYRLLCGLPFRDANGKLSWPRFGNGVYWSLELRSAERLGAIVTYRAGWRFDEGCACKPFAWVADWYQKRRELEAEGRNRGKPVKLAINALYGKTAQRIGKPRWANVIHAGLMTAMTRAAINDAIAGTNLENVVMIATDAVYTIRKPLPLDLGEGMGQWERKRYRSLFLVKPGLYWPSRPHTAEFKLKSRGLSQSIVIKHTLEFQAAMRRYIKAELKGTYHKIPKVEIIPDLFIGLRLAYRLGDLEAAASWIRKPVFISFDWLDKRGRMRVSLDRKHLILDPLPGSIAAHSNAYRKGAAKPEWADELELDRLHIEDMPDAVELTPPYVED
jgi:hypothetical protein